MADVRVVWHCKTCHKHGYVDVRGKLVWSAIMDLINTEHTKLSPKCQLDVYTNFVPITEPGKS
jgi:hypothetical protein